MSTKLLTDAIVANIENFIAQSRIFENTAKVPKKDEKLIVLNNTFFFRERTYIKTTKSEKYLAIPASEGKLDENSYPLRKAWQVDCSLL